MPYLYIFNLYRKVKEKCNKKRPKTLINKVLSPPAVGRRGLEPRTP